MRRRFWIGLYSGTSYSYNIYGITSRPDDVQFVSDVVAQVSANIHPDAKQISMWGFSGGGMFIHRLAYFLSNIFSAGVAVSGNALVLQLPPSANQAPIPAQRPNPGSVSLLMLFGDVEAGYCSFLNKGATVPGADETFSLWTNLYGCKSQTPQSSLCDANGKPTGIKSNGKVTGTSTILATQYSDGAEVQFYELLGGDHMIYTTPMDNVYASPYNPAFGLLVGRTDIEIIWNFLKSHRKQ